MTVSAAELDRIVANVLNRLGDRPGSSRPRQTTRGGERAASVVIDERVVTADLIDPIPRDGVVIVSTEAIITPAAWDAVNERNIRLERRSDSPITSNPQAPAQRPSVSDPGRQLRPLLIVVRHTVALNRLWEELSDSTLYELVDCPDDAAKLAISAVCRGEALPVIVMVEQAHRTACAANRNDRIKAAAVLDVGTIKSVRRQLRANVWCLDPSERSYFELKNMYREIVSNANL